MLDNNPNRPRLLNGLSVSGKTSLQVSDSTNSAPKKTLAVQMALTALNAKSDLDDELSAEFYRVFSHEPPQAIQWAFQAWREKSPFFPAVSDIRKLLAEWHRGARERLELESRMEEKFLLEERRNQGQLVDFQEAARQLRKVCESASRTAEPMQRESQFGRKMQGKWRGVAEIIPTIHLSEEQIAARRQKERAECEEY